MSAPTTFLSRLFGLYFIFASLSMITRGQATVNIVTSMVLWQENHKFPATETGGK